MPTWDWAALTDAWSAASWALDALLAWSWESWDWAPARLARACAACALSEAESMVARIWPFVTRCPTVDIDRGDLAGRAEAERRGRRWLDGAGGGERLTHGGR